MQRKNQLKKMKINYFFKEVNNNEKNYQLNMEILSSLKSLPGKVVNLQSEKYISKNEDSNKKIIFPEEKHTTSSSLSKELYNDPFFNVNDTEKSNKKLYHLIICNKLLFFEAYIYVILLKNYGGKQYEKGCNYYGL